MLPKFTITLIMFLVLPFYGQSQESFPEKCLGEWDGTLYIYRLGQLTDSIPVSLAVKRTRDPKAFKWVTTYKSEQYPMTKDYLLKFAEAGNNEYIMEEDEQTEILMYAFENKIYSLFETQNTMLSSTYELKADTLYFEVNSASQQATGSLVNSFKVEYLQKVAFTRLKED